MEGAMATDGAAQTKLLQFVPLSSAVDVGFWHRLTKNKLELYKLDESSIDLIGCYVNNDPDGLPCRANVDYDCFNSSFNPLPRTFPIYGELHNKNTIESFKTCDKQQLLNAAANKIWNGISSGVAIEKPHLLTTMLLLTFADLKKYNFYYWFGFPALLSDPALTVRSSLPISNIMNPSQISRLQASYDHLSKLIEQDPVLFLVRVDGDEVVLGQMKDWKPFFKGSKQVTIGFSDPCTDGEHPGWPLRNFLALVSYHWGGEISTLTVICYRDKIRNGKREASHSIVLQVEGLSAFNGCQECPKATGWERNKNQKMGPRIVNLSNTMDPIRLAESAVDLNLKLMRWRLLPDLQLDKIAATRCLLLGSGTLGCNVARSLLAWGVRTITFLDNGKVSYSNPVRQSLFQFDDCKSGGKDKAQAASDAMRRIYPSVKCDAHTLSIPMPGHAVGETDEARMRVREDVVKLEALVESHDVLFLLMDTRESRWLPTLLGAAHGKIVINAALGFDSFVVMRHGLKRQQSATDDAKTDEPTVTSGTVRIPGDKLGCYYCNDVVAPGDSTRDRTLDMQCTVTRPGVSMMASSLAVELLMSILHHPEGGYAAAESTAKDDHLSADFQSSLGIVPHQIRGFLSRFHFVMPSCLAFDLCTGCSQKVIDAYRQDGFEFLLKVFNIPQYLEEMTGLLELHRSTVDAEIWELSDDDSDES